jgi:hypothetical protein
LSRRRTPATASWLPDRSRQPSDPAPQRQPHRIRCPGGRPRLALEFLPPRSNWSEAAGRFGHGVTCARIWYLVSWVAQRQPQSIRRPIGHPCLTRKHLPRLSRWSEPAGGLGHMVKCARILRLVGSAPHRRQHSIRRLDGRPRLACEFRAYGEVRGHIAPGEFGAATPTARHARYRVRNPSAPRAADFNPLPGCAIGRAGRSFARGGTHSQTLSPRSPVSGSPQLQPHFIRGPRGCPMRLNVGSCSNFLTRNPSPTLATSLLHTMTAERQNGAAVLRKVNVLAAAQTDGHVSGASRTARVIEPPFGTFARGVLQLFHFKARLERKPAFPSRWRARGSIAGGLRGVWVRAIWPARPSAGAQIGVRASPSTSSRGVPRGWGLPALRAHGEMRTHPARRDPGAQRQPHSNRRPGRGPGLAFGFLLRGSTWSEAAGRFAHIVKCARISRPVSSAPQPRPNFIRGSAGVHA